MRALILVSVALGIALLLIGCGGSSAFQPPQFEAASIDATVDAEGVFGGEIFIDASWFGYNTDFQVTAGSQPGFVQICLITDPVLPLCTEIPLQSSEEDIEAAVEKLWAPKY